MSDRELLEMAAKAAGIKGRFSESHPEDGAPCYSCGINRGNRVSILWNPLTDDGDAFRLSVKLRMDVEQSVPQDNDRWVCASIAESGFQGKTESFDDESRRAAATRRAIVLVAAAIGEYM